MTKLNGLELNHQESLVWFKEYKKVLIDQLDKEFNVVILRDKNFNAIKII